MSDYTRAIVSASVKTVYFGNTSPFCRQLLHYARHPIIASTGSKTAARSLSSLAEKYPKDLLVWDIPHVASVAMLSSYNPTLAVVDLRSLRDIGVLVNDAASLGCPVLVTEAWDSPKSSDTVRLLGSALSLFVELSSEGNARLIRWAADVVNK